MSGALTALGYVDAFTAVALALTTTALGTVLSILREKGMLGGALGRHFLASGAVGELFPIIAIAIFLSVNSRFSALISLAAIALVALLLAASAHLVRGRRLAHIALQGADATSQTTLRLTIVLLLGLLVLAAEFGLDVVMGAFLAGVVLRRWTPGDLHALEAKLDAIGYGFFIPVFFVTAGMGIDLQSIRESPARLVVFLFLLLAVRGLPILVVYRKALPSRERVRLMLLSATTLPLLVALTQIGVSSGTMRTDNAAALVGAGVLSVLFFPLLAIGLHRPTAEPEDSSTPASPRVRLATTRWRQPCRWRTIGSMPSSNQWIAFLVASFLFIQIPGPSVLFMLGRALTVGRRDALVSVAGNGLGLMVQATLVAIGLGAVVAASATAYSVLKIVGAAYVVWLGIQAIRHRGDARRAMLEGRGAPSEGRRALLTGLVVGLTNPKTIVFFVAFLPQFTDETAAAGPQIALLGLVFAVMAITSDSIWAILAGKARDWFAREPRRLDRLGVAGGVMMIGLGGTMAATE